MGDWPLSWNKHIMSIQICYLDIFKYAISHKVRTDFRLKADRNWPEYLFALDWNVFSHTSQQTSVSQHSRPFAKLCAVKHQNQFVEPLSCADGEMLCHKFLCKSNLGEWLQALVTNETVSVCGDYHTVNIYPHFHGAFYSKSLEKVKNSETLNKITFKSQITCQATKKAR